MRIIRGLTLGAVAAMGVLVLQSCAALPEILDDAGRTGDVLGSGVADTRVIGPDLYAGESANKVPPRDYDRRAGDRFRVDPAYRERDDRYRSERDPHYRDPGDDGRYADGRYADGRHDGRYYDRERDEWRPAREETIRSGERWTQEARTGDIDKRDRRSWRGGRWSDAQKRIFGRYERACLDAEYTDDKRDLRRRCECAMDGVISKIDKMDSQKNRMLESGIESELRRSLRSRCAYGFRDYGSRTGRY